MLASVPVRIGSRRGLVETPAQQRLQKYAYTAAHRVVVTVEDGVRAGGVGEAIAATLRDAGVPTPIHNVGVPVGFHPHGSRGELLTELGLTAQDVARDAIAWVTQRSTGTSVI